MNEGDIRLSDSVGIGRDLESADSHYGAEMVGLGVLIQQDGDASGQHGVPASRRAHANDPTLDQLVVIVVVGNSREFFGSDQTVVSRHVVTLHGILASSNARAMPGEFLRDRALAAVSACRIFNSFGLRGKQCLLRADSTAVLVSRLERKLRLLADTPYVEDQVQVSPGGERAAMEVLESGMPDVYVATFPGLTDKTKVSVAGGSQPRWRQDGRELFYLTPDGTMMVVEAAPSSPSGFRPGRPLFRSPLVPRFQPAGIAQYDVTADGQRFLFLEPVKEPVDAFTFLLNWTEGLKK